MQHPVCEAELASVEETPDGPRVTRVGKRLVAAEEAAGEFIGLAQLLGRGRGGAGATSGATRSRAASSSPSARRRRCATPTSRDALNADRRRGVPLVPVFIDGRWREIDTEEDLARAHALVDTWG